MLMRGIGHCAAERLEFYRSARAAWDDRGSCIYGVYGSVRGGGMGARKEGGGQNFVA